MTADQQQKELTNESGQSDQVTDRILTGPNVITFIRLLMLPLFLWLQFGLHADVPALVVFGVAAATDWVDGQLARRTHQVSKLGKALDPAVDRLLICVGVISVFLLGRVPLWVVIYLIARELILLCGGKYLLDTVGKFPPVVYPGKVATAFLMFGFSFLLLGLPEVSGLGIPWAPAWLPGLGAEPTLLGMWLIYVGLICSVSVFVYYIVQGIRLYVPWRAEHRQSH